MKKRRIFLILALWGCLATYGQGIYYEWWIDNNRTHVHSGRFSQGEQTVSFDLSAMPYAGLHFLNIVPYADNGEQGVWKCMAFMVPECWPGTTNAVTMEYWVSSYDKVPIRKTFTGPNIAFDIDISRMSYGLHFLNYRTQNERGEYGPWTQIMFYISNGAFDREAMSFQYWIDNGEKQNGRGYTPGEIPLSINTEGLSKGKHTFYYRVCYSQNPSDANATFGETVSMTFELKDLIGDVNGDGNVDVADIACVIDCMAGSQTVNKTAADVNQDNTVDVADIATIISIMAANARMAIVED